MIRRNQKGFTLIEALIVVIIVAILAVLGISRFLGVREATAQATCQSHLSTLNSAFKKWQLDNPTGTFVEGDVTVAGSTAEEAWIDAGSPTCPSAGVYSYAVTGVATEFESSCTLHGTLSAPL